MNSDAYCDEGSYCKINDARNHYDCHANTGDQNEYNDNITTVGNDDINHHQVHSRSKYNSNY